jgi:hypothetical protein
MTILNQIMQEIGGSVVGSKEKSSNLGLGTFLK